MENENPLGDTTTPEVDKSKNGANTTTQEEELEVTTIKAAATVVKKDKINILLKPVGDAPILKQKLWAVAPDKKVSAIILFVKSYLKIEGDSSLFLFVNQAFAPSPDQLMRNLYECFGSDGKLVLHYSTTTAWG